VPLGQFDFDLVRKSGQPVQKDITNFMRASGCFDTNLSGTCDQGEKTFNNIWIFNLEALQEYFWEYDKYGCGCRCSRGQTAVPSVRCSK
jgi:hypothetical protein